MSHPINVTLLFAAAFVSASVSARTFRVAPAAPGAPEPLAAALDAARLEPGPHEIVLADGVYFLDKTLTLDVRDSNLVIRAEHAGKAVLTGGEKIAGWTREADGTWRAPVAVKPDGSDGFYALTSKGRPLPRAVWPLDGSRLKNLGDWNVPGLSTVAGGWARKPTDAERRRVPYAKKDLPPGFDFHGVQIRLFHMWSETLAGIASNDDATATWTLASPAYWPAGARGRRDYVLENLRAGLAKEGAWMLDFAAGCVRYRPFPGEDPAKTVLVAARTRTLVSAQDGKNRPIPGLRFSGLVFENAGSELHDAGFGGGNQPSALYVRRAPGCVVEDVVFRCCAGTGLKVLDANGARVVGCSFADTGARALEVAGDDVLVERCRLLRSGVLYSSASAAHVRGKRNVFRLNEIDWAAYCGLISGGSGMLIESNRVSRAMRVLHDGAAFYGGMTDGLTRGNVVSDCTPNGSGYGVSAYYWDEQSSNCRVEDNVSLNVALPVHFHMTRGMHVSGNTFVSTNGMRISFQNSIGGTFTDNRCWAGGAFNVGYPEGINAWRGNAVTTTNGLGAIAFSDGAAFCVKKPRPKKGNAVCIRLPPGVCPKVDGKISSGEYGAPSLFSVDRDEAGCAVGFMPVYAGLCWDATNLYAAVEVVYDGNALAKGVTKGTAWGVDDGVELTLGSAKIRAFAGGKIEWPSPAWVARAKGCAGLTDGAWGGYKNFAVYEFAIPFDLLGEGPARDWLKLPYGVTSWRPQAGLAKRIWDAAPDGRFTLRPAEQPKAKKRGGGVL